MVCKKKFRNVSKKLIQIGLICILAFSFSGQFNQDINSFADNASITALSESFFNTDNGVIPIEQNIIGYSSLHRPGVQMTPQYITVHNTANPNAGADADMHSNYMVSSNTHSTYLSWHYTVDNTEIVQHVPLNEIAYHAGDSLGDGNMSSIGIEICENADGSYRDAEENTEDLIAHLLLELNLDISRVVPHQHWSGKHCPHNMLDGTGGSVGWDQFIANIQAKLTKLKEEKEEATPEEDAGKETVKVGEKVGQMEALQMAVGESSPLAVYQDDAYPTYQITEDNSDVEITAKNNTTAQTLNADSKINYSQVIKVLSSDFEVKDANATFNNLVKDTNVDIVADENFFDKENRKFKTDGFSTITFLTEKGRITFAVYNYVLYNPIIVTKKEADTNGWSLQNISMDLTTVMSGASQAEVSKVTQPQNLTLSLIAIMNQNTETKEEKKDPVQNVNTPVAQEKTVNRLVFTSSDDSIVSVSDGILIAKGKGTAQITTTINGITLTRTVTVS